MPTSLTIKKEPLEFQPDAQIDLKKLKNKRYHNSTWEPQNATFGGNTLRVTEVSIAVLRQDGKRFAQFDVMGADLVVPDKLCWFYVKVEYPWRIRTGAQDDDEFLTDGEVFYIARRDLADSPFVLNTENKEIINAAIASFVEDI